MTDFDPLKEPLEGETLEEWFMRIATGNTVYSFHKVSDMADAARAWFKPRYVDRARASIGMPGAIERPGSFEGCYDQE